MKRSTLLFGCVVGLLFVLGVPCVVATINHHNTTTSLLATPPNAALAIPTQLLSNAFQKLSAAVTNLFSKLALPNCCYKLKGLLHTNNLDFTGMNVSDSSLSLGIMTNATGLFVTGGLKMTINGVYDYCAVKNDKCDPINKCNGDFRISLNAAIEAGVGLSLSNGKLVLTAEDADNIISTLSVDDNLCTTLKVELGTVVDVAKPLVNKQLKTTITELLANITRDFPYSANATVAELSWLFTSQTQPTANASNFLLTVGVATPSGKVAPVTQTAAPSLPELDDGNIHLSIGDSILSSLLYVLAEDGMLSFHYNASILNYTLAMDVNTTGEVVDFNVTKGSVSINATLNGMFESTLQPLKAAVTFTAALLPLEVVPVMNGSTIKAYNITINLKGLHLKILSCHGPCALLDLVRDGLLPQLEQALNGLLSKSPISIPSGNGLLSNLAINSHLSFIDLSIGVSIPDLSISPPSLSCPLLNNTIPCS
eukprot:m.357515 g.357515  ORF g.357515 m.357515 type:complete len:482 (-) comp17860_c0_seq1:1820-3265(-)